MDKSALVKAIEKVVASFAEEQKRFDLVNLEPLMPGNTYILNVCADWIHEADCYEAIDLITARLFQYLPADLLKFVNRVNILDRDGELHCWADDEEMRPKAIQIVA